MHCLDSVLTAITYTVQGNYFRNLIQSFRYFQYIYYYISLLQIDYCNKLEMDYIIKKKHKIYVNVHIHTDYLLHVY